MATARPKPGTAQSGDHGPGPSPRIVPDLFRISGQDRVVDVLGRLTFRPPRVLLLEGGTAEEREKLGLYWAALLNCTEAVPRARHTTPPGSAATSSSGHAPARHHSETPPDTVPKSCLGTASASVGQAVPGPCGQCPACCRIRDGVFLDLIYLDGREGRIGIDAVRDLRGVLGQAPRDAVRRVVILGEAQELTEQAANALLKSMEDTETRNAYVLLAPQRERLLRTLVSRSWVATLSWDLEAGDEGIGENGKGGADAQWCEALAGFLKTGRGWFSRTMTKGQVDRPLAFQVIRSCRRSLITACQGRPKTSLARVFHDLGRPQAWRAIDLRLDNAEEALRTQVAPALVLDWLAVGLRQALKY
ncbi:MAG: DNA polymerase III subunit delta' [Desulfovibrionales bacterium]|nr:MAG: DNA polymerase III subunit delta' [Desulfovibrionales bacterium]